MEFLRANQRDDGAFDAHHAADKGVDQNQKRELLPIGAQPEVDGRARQIMRRHSAAAGIVPELIARIRAACGGAGGTSASMACTKASSSSIRSALLYRRSNPIVDAALPLRLRPQIEPEYAPGNTSR